MRLQPQGTNKQPNKALHPTAYSARVERGTSETAALPAAGELGRYVAIDEDVRRCMARKFPYGVLYTIEQDYILILAVMHRSREPGYWKSRK